MTSKKLPYGSWPSPFSAELVGGKQMRFGHLQVDDNRLFWLEGRPEENGRVVLMVKEPDMAPRELTPPHVSVKSKIHEYGGGDFLATGERVFFVNAFDQNIYEISATGISHVTHAFACRFADLFHDKDRDRLLAVCEDHSHDSHLPVNKIVSISLGEEKGQITDIITGSDFYARPGMSDCGTYLSYIAWSRPYMPWDAAGLHIDKLDAQGLPQAEINMLGGFGSAVFQPLWHGHHIYFVCEFQNWNNICRSSIEDNFSQIDMVWECSADFGRPQWVFGQRSYAIIDEHKLVASYFDEGINKLATFDLETKKTQIIDPGFESLDMIDVSGNDVIGYASRDDMPSTLVRFPINSASQKFNIIRSSAEEKFDSSHISKSKLITFPTRDGCQAYGLYYPPQNGSYEGLKQTEPPMIVSAHGGPTGMADRGLKLKIQYWTSRGFAFLDVDYRGSSGYGKEYRQALDGHWGVLDVTDVIDGANWCVSEGLADKDKLIISGSSAGGLTVLNALAHHDVFKAGACYYAVSDLQALCEETHKFEIDYIYSLTGINSGASEKDFKPLSPKYHFTDISVPVIFFQGDNDPIVPASQSRHIFSELRARGSIVAYTEFEGEGHGFRKEETLRTALSQEYYFYGRIFGFETPLLDHDITDLVIENF